MANALFLSPYYSDLATVTIGGGVTSGFPATNMQVMRPTTVCRTAGVGSQTINIDFGASGAIAATAFALWSPFSGTGSLGSGTTWAIGASNTSLAAAVTSPSLAAVSGGTSIWIGSKPTTPGLPFPCAFATWSNSTAYRYWAITIIDGSGASYYDICRIMLGVALQPGLNVDGNIGITYDSSDLIARSAYNQSISDRRGYVARRLDLTFSSVSESEMRLCAALVRQAGAGGDFFFAVDPADTSNFSEWSGQFYFSQMPALGGVPLFISGRPAWQLKAALSECL